MQEKINNLTGLRAYAATWVALYHFNGTLGTSIPTFIGPVIGNGAWGVDIFFVLSGFILSHIYSRNFRENNIKFSDFKIFIVKRFARIYPMHFFTFLLTCAFLIIALKTNFQFSKDHDFGLYTALLNIFMVQAWGLEKTPSWNQVSWSISAEWFAYLFLFFSIIKLSTKINLSKFIFCLVVVWLLLIVYSNFYLKKDISSVVTFGIARIIPEFLGGYVVYELSNKSPNLVKLNGIIKSINCDLVAFIALIAICGLANLPYAFNIFLLPFIMLLIGALNIGGPYSNIIFGNKTVLYFGEISYSVYLIHPFVNIVGKRFSEKIIYCRSLNWLFLVVLFEFIFLIVLASISFHLIEKPFREKIVSLFYPKSKNTIPQLAELP